MMFKWLKLFISGKLIWQVVCISTNICLFLTLWAMNVDIETNESVKELSAILVMMVVVLLVPFFYAVIFGYWAKFLEEEAPAYQLILGYIGSTILLIINLSAYLVVYENMSVPDVYWYVVKNWLFWWKQDSLVSSVSSFTLILFLIPLSSRLKKFLRQKLRDFSNYMEGS